MHVVASSPAKSILFGEHSVVYNRKALAVALDYRLRISLRSEPTKNEFQNVLLTFHFPCLSEKCVYLNEKQLKDFLNITSSFQTMCPEYSVIVKDWVLKNICDVPDSVISSCGAILIILFLNTIASEALKVLPLHIKVNSEIPIGAGLGSSAALCTAAAASWLILCRNIDPDCTNWTADHRHKVSSLAFIGEQFLHASPSGMDNTVCTFGGTVMFSRSSGLQLAKTRFHFSLLIVNTKVERSTKDLVQGVRHRWEMERDKYESLFSQIESVTLKANTLLCGSDERGDEVSDEKTVLQLSKYVAENQKLLEEIGVSHESIESVIGVLLDFGLAGKLTGAGGGGCVVSFLPSSFNQMEDLKATLENKGFEVWMAPIGAEGVKTEAD